MSVSDTTSSLTMKDILANSSKKTSSTTTGGIASATNSATGGQALGKDAFLQLLVTQLKNQNPLDPQDNSAFVAQLAQFSSLEGITTLNSTVSSLAGNYNSSQALQASSLVGRNVIVQTNTVQLDDPSKGMTGSVTVPSSIAGGTVTITDSSGTAIRTIDLGSRAAGNASFTWDGKDKDGNLVKTGTYTVKANASINGTATDLATYLPATVNSVTISQTGGELMLNLAGNYNSSQALQASSLVGRNVIVQTNTAQLDDPSKGLTGTATVPSSIAGGTVTITDSSGKTVRTIDLGSRAAGPASFTWDGKDSSGTLVPVGTYTFKANASINGTATDLATYLPATVNSVTISQTGGELMLNLSGKGTVALSKVQTIGI